MKSCIKEILLIITHAVGGICDSSRRKIIRQKLITTLHRSESRCNESALYK